MSRAMISVCLATSILFGCAKIPPPSRQEQLTTTTRIYNQPPEKIFAAARRVFELNDGSDYGLIYPDTETLHATREWFLFIPFGRGGQHVWTITATPLGKGSAVEASVLEDGLPRGGTASYDLFYARLEYILGIASTWRTCGQQREITASGIGTGTPRAFCDFLAKENRPI